MKQTVIIIVVYVVLVIFVDKWLSQPKTSLKFIHSFIHITEYLHFHFISSVAKSTQ